MSLLWPPNHQNLMTPNTFVYQQLQNLQYQKIHLNKELHVCLNYHGHEGIELISEAEFEANTTEDQRKGPRGSHAYELARLTFEMKKREELVSSLKTHELRRKLYEGKLAMQRKFLDSLQVSLFHFLVPLFPHCEILNPNESLAISGAFGRDSRCGRAGQKRVQQIWPCDRLTGSGTLHRAECRAQPRISSSGAPRRRRRQRDSFRPRSTPYTIRHERRSRFD